MGSSGKDRQAALAARRRAAGLVQVAVWVREDRKAELVAFAAVLTEPAPPPKALPPVTSPPPASDPRQIDLEDAIRAKVAPIENNQVICDVMPAADLKAYGAAVRAARLAKGYRRVCDLAEAVKMSRGGLGNIENGTYRASAEAAARLEAALGPLPAICGTSPPHRTTKAAQRPLDAVSETGNFPKDFDKIGGVK